MPNRSHLDRLSQRLSTLSDTVRLRMLRLLDRQELSVGELALALQLPQSTVSRHLKVLHEGDLVTKRTEGTASLYRLDAEQLDAEARALWALAREQLRASPTLEEDDTRLAEVLARRRGDSQTFFGRIGSEWDHLRRDLFGTRFTADVLLALLDPAWVVADIGCGTGNACAAIAPFVGRIIAIDQETAMLDAARARLAEFDTIEFVEGDLHAIPLDDGCADAAMIFLVLHHLEAPADAIREAARIVRPGGRLLVVDMTEHDRESYRQTMGHRHLGFSQDTVAAWAADAGVTLERYQRLRPDPEVKGPGLFVATMRCL